MKIVHDHLSDREAGVEATREAAYRRGAHQAAAVLAGRLANCRTLVDARSFAAAFEDVLAVGDGG